MKLTKYKLSLLMLTLLLFVTLTAFFCLNAVSARASGTVTVGKSNVFNATGNADVSAGASDDTFYTTFTFTSGDDAVSYRRNLAYHWFEQAGSEDGEESSTKEKVAGYFNMEIGFKSVSFEKFVITFESQEYNKSKEAKAVNYLIFYPATSGNVYVWATTDKEDTVESMDESKKISLGADNITIAFDGRYNDGYTSGYNVSVTSGEKQVSYEFKNVGGNYSKASTSTTSPLYPLIFNAEFAEEEENSQTMTLYSLNGQSFEMSSETATTVTDSMPPVLCLNEEVRYFTQGDKISVNYTVIDVLRTSPSATINYYVLTDEQYVSSDIDYSDAELFEELDDDFIILAGKDKYLPSAADLSGTVFNSSAEEGKLTVDMMLRVYIELSDYSSTSYKETAEVYLDWYMDDDYLINYKGASFIAVAKDELGATYAYDGADGVSWSYEEGGKIAAYQAEIDKLAKDLSAGSSSYLYLPSVESLFEDNASAYTDMKYSIYYKHNTESSSTSLSSSGLSINLTQKGPYTFTVYATDAAGNNMYYLEQVEKAEEADTVVNGAYYKYVEFATSDIWNMFNDHDADGLYYKLPWFTFEVGYSGVQFEETPGMQSTAYVGTSYTPAGFKINGISGTYSTNYRLFVFDRAGYYTDNNNKTFTYEEFIADMDSLFENSETRKYFKEILQVSETDAEYEDFKDYAWSNSSTTFTPQDANAFYYIRAEVEDNSRPYKTDTITCSLAVLASANAKTLKGENDWLKNNIASVILLVIAGLSLVGIILLLVIKPKNSEDLDVQFEKAKKKEKKNN